MRELLQDVILMYTRYRGNGRLIPLALVALLLCYVIIVKTKKGRRINPAVFFLYLQAGIAYALIEITKLVCNPNSNKNRDKFDRLLSLIALLIVAFALCLSGNRILSSEYFVKADNSMHIRQEYVDVMDRILMDDDNPGVIAPYEMSPYFTMYSSRFNMLYDYPKDADLDLLNKDAREAYEELFGYEPDTFKLAQIAKRNNLSYVIISSGRHYPEFPLSTYGFIELDRIGDYIIYKDAGGDL